MSRILIAVTAGLVLCGCINVASNSGNAASGPAAGQVNSLQDEIAAVFAKASTEHIVCLPPFGLGQQISYEFAKNPGGPPTATAPDRQEPHYRMWSLRRGDYPDPGLTYSPALEDFVCKVQALIRANSPQAAKYIQTAGGFLKHKDAVNRALACEVLAHLPAQAVEQGLLPDIGDCLDDAAVPFKTLNDANFPMTEVPSYAPAKAPLTVGRIANLAAGYITGLEFPSRAAFRQWWQRNNDYTRALWYWRVRWVRIKPDEDLAALAKLDPKEAMRIMLLVNNSDALADEILPRGERKTGTEVASGLSLFSSSPSGQAIADFARKHAMKNDLLCLYRQSPTWLRLPDNSGYGEMLYRVTSSLGLLLDRNDVPAVTAILESSTDRVAMSEDLLAKLAMTAAKLDPDRAEGTLLAQLQRTPKQSQLAVMAAELNPAKAEEILLAQLQRMPGESYLAVRLVKVSGLAHFDLVKKSYHTSGGESDNQSVIAAIGDLKSKAAAKALGELLAGDDLSVAENPVRQNRYGYNETRQRIFTAYVQAAEMINGKAVIDKELFNQALTQTGKFTTPQMEAHNKQTGAFRKQALNELTKFFAQQ